MLSLQLGRDFCLYDRIKIFVIKKKADELLFCTTASRSCCNKAISYSKLCQRAVGQNIYMFVGCGHDQFPSNTLRFKQKVPKSCRYYKCIQKE